ncbi:hypothetical protein V5P93_001025 [Actinokineospora auranticolor]|uniref:WXG100 family type VII secretion target n=1 Tax=Actinokineospora auranticolor TaxID=155976 RepID=UPI0011AFD911|nr:hypothetical protein [Actinokineospora auranticolor]
MTGRQADDRYVTGGVNWESYSLEQLVKMVAEQASAPQLERLADDWRAAGTEVVDASDVLRRALDDLMDFWSGTAAEQARTDVALNAQWVADLGETAHQIGDPIQEAAGALKAAQDAMPDLPDKPAVPPAQAADSAARGLDAGGPLVSAITGTAAGAESAFTAEQEQAQLKVRAVEAMKRFEGAAIGIDQATPRFEERGTELRPEPGDPGTPQFPPIRQPPSLPPGGIDGRISYETDVRLRWESLTASGDPGTAVQSLDSSAGGGSAGIGGGFGGGGGGAAYGGADAGRAALQPGGSVGVTEAVTGGGRAPVPMGGGGGLAAASGSAGAGAGMGVGGMPMGGAGMGAGGSESGEYRRRYPYDAEDPFALDQKASPPVIGL